MVLLAAVIISGCFLLEEPLFLIYPFEELTVWKDIDNIEDYKIIYDTGSEKSFYLLDSRDDYQYDYDGDKDRLSLELRYIQDESIVSNELFISGTDRLINLVPLDEEGLFALILRSSTSNNGVIQIYSVSIKDNEAEFSLKAEREVVPADFDSMNGPVTPHMGWYEDGRLYLACPGDDVIYDISYKVDGNSISDPKETFTSFLSTTEAVSGDDQFWDIDTLNLRDFYHDSNEGLSYYLLTRKEHFTHKETLFLIAYNGSIEEKEEFELKSYTTELEIVKTNGDLLESRAIDPEDGPFRLSITGYEIDNGLEQNKAVHVIDTGDYTYYLGQRNYNDIHSILVGIEFDDDSLDFVIYSLPYSYFLEEDQ